jgi:hypothetical protein
MCKSNVMQDLMLTVEQQLDGWRQQRMGNVDTMDFAPVRSVRAVSKAYVRSFQGPVTVAAAARVGRVIDFAWAPLPPPGRRPAAALCCWQPLMTAVLQC